MELVVAILLGWWFFDDVIKPKLEKIDALEQRIAELEKLLKEKE